SGRPVVFVPFIHQGGMKLTHVMVCWDGSRAATRAIADSLPLLKKAKTVEIKRITSPEIDVASTILSYAADSDADMIVTGGYGHSRLREFVLGGVTRGLLQSMTVPVLMSH